MFISIVRQDWVICRSKVTKSSAKRTRGKKQERK